MRIRSIAIAALATVSAAAVVPAAESAGRTTATGYLAGERWWAPGDGRTFPRVLDYTNETGTVRTLNLGGPTDTRGHPFFTPLGTNGRACITCHQPADGMSLSVETIRGRWRDTQGRDPLFAAIDGSNCPSQPQGRESSHSLLLDHGLFRVARSWPPRTTDGTVIEPEFTIEVVRDPTGCNLDPVYGLKSASPAVSVYRRPRPVTNLKYLTVAGFPFEPKNGLPLPRDPETGELISGNLMADARAATLKAQALDAMQSHLETVGDPHPRLLEKIIEFETQLYTAQVHDRRAGSLTADGARGGPELLAASKPGVLNSTAHPMWDEFESWIGLADTAPNGQRDEQRAFRASVGRGVELFRNRRFLVSDSTGVNSMNFGNPTINDCNWCHNMYRFGNDVAPGQVDLGTTNEPFANPAPHLPLFRLTCAESRKEHPFLGRVVYTTDPGFALTTGKCADIGKITIQSSRGLAARAPYFANGSAKTLREMIDFYDRRYNMRLTEQEKQDFTNLMSVL